MSAITLNHQRTDRLISVFVALCVVAIAGIISDTWQIVFLSVPALISVLFIQGTLRQDDSWDKTAVAPVAAYLVGLSALFVAVVVTAGSTTRLWGLPLSIAIVFYVIWPYTAVLSGFIYAYVFQRNSASELVA